MMLELDLQLTGEWPQVPAADDFEDWVKSTLEPDSEVEMTIRVVGREESRELNRTYRGKDSETNVLSFPAELPDEIELPLLGDLVICAPLVADEAAAQGKALRDHWAHLTIHGVLHLMGYDHLEDDDAEEMESLEISLLESLGINNPYG